MSLADYSMTVFALLNAARAIAYIPQIVRICRDPHKASAVSVTTWILFAAANLATVLYAITAFHDGLMACIFGLNALGCAAIAGLTFLKRTRVIARLRQVPRAATMAATGAAIVMLTTMASGLFVGRAFAAEHEPILPLACAQRELRVITLIEDHGEGMYVRPYVSDRTLVWASDLWLEARKHCYGGRTLDAVAVYDEIVTKLSRATAQAPR